MKKRKSPRKLATPYGRPFPGTQSKTKRDFDSKPPRVRFVKPLADKSRDEDEESDKPALKAPTGVMVMKKFDDVWSSLFSSPIHLDSALSKQPRNVKTILAQILPSILLRPSSQAELMGVGIAPGEPWSLQLPALARWKTSRTLAQRLHQMMSSRIETPSPQPADFPPAMIQEWESAWGKETMLELVETLGTEAPLSLRASRKFGAQSVLGELTKDSRLPVKAQLSTLSPMGVRLSGYTPVLGSDLYKKGAFEIQDEGSQLMALFALWPELYAFLLQPKPGKAKSTSRLPAVPTDTQPWTVVDACAGAGGKSLAMSDALKGKGRVFAYDISATKLQALRRRATQAGLNNIQAVALKEGEEAQTISKFKRRAHVVLVDAPCSGWGVLRRNPDIKWRQDPSALDRMPQIQLRLLSQYAALVAGEGRLVYGVCTFRKEETTEVVQRFLEENPEFVAGPGGYVGPGPSDGFFMQSFVRRKQKGV